MLFCNIKISKVLVPAITTSPIIQTKGKPDGIDLIQLAAAEIQVKEQRRRIDERLQLLFGSTQDKSTSVKYSTKIEPINMELMPVGSHKDGEASSKELQAIILKPNERSNKDSTKNPLKEVDFPPSKDDENKILGRSIAYLKKSMEEAVRRNRAIIIREGKSICVMQGHPKFSIAKKEEAKQLKADKRAQAKLEKQLKSSQVEEMKGIEVRGEEKIANLDEVLGSIFGENMEEREEWQKGNRRKAKAHRRSEDNPEDTKSISKPLPSIPEPLVANPTINIHGEPIDRKSVV